MATISTEQWAVRARAALIIAAGRRSLVTYGELGHAIGWNPTTPISHHARRILDAVSEVCEQRGEPSLAALVVADKTGKPGAGWLDGIDAQGNARPWHTEMANVFRHTYQAHLD